VVAEVNNYERLESDQGTAKYYIKADYAKTFSDNHQELQNMYLEVYDKEGQTTKLRGRQRPYVPDQDKDFTAYVKGNVNIDTPQGLNVKTSNIVYTKKTEDRGCRRGCRIPTRHDQGRSFGATVRMADKQLDLLKDVEIESFESPELMKSGVRYAKINAASAMLDQLQNRIGIQWWHPGEYCFESKVGSRPVDGCAGVESGGVSRRSEGKTPSLKKLELWENVHIVSAEAGSRRRRSIPDTRSLIRRVTLRVKERDTHRNKPPRTRSTEIRSSDAIYDQPH